MRKYLLISLMVINLSFIHFLYASHTEKDELDQLTNHAMSQGLPVHPEMSKSQLQEIIRDQQTSHQ